MHPDPKYHVIKDKYRVWLKNLQYRYKEASGRSRGGIIVSDALNKRPGGELFR